MSEMKNTAAETDIEDSTEALLEKYDRKRSQRTDDIIATQAVVCLITAMTFFAANLFFPKGCGEMWEYICSLSMQKKEIIPNIIDVVMQWISSR